MGNVTPLKPAGNTRRRHSPYVGFPLRNDAIEGSKLNLPPTGDFITFEGETEKITFENELEYITFEGE